MLWEAYQCFGKLLSRYILFRTEFHDCRELPHLLKYRSTFFPAEISKTIYVNGNVNHNQ